MSKFMRLGTLCLLLMLAMVGKADSFKDFAIIINDQEGTILTEEELVEGTELSFGLAVAKDGTVSRVAVDDATSIATISGIYENQHGCSSLKVVIPNASNIRVSVGQCQHSESAITLTDGNGKQVATVTPTNPACWNDDATNLNVLNYIGDATTLTISGMDLCPYIAVRALTAEELEELIPKSTLTYYNTDGTVLGQQKVKTGKTIGEFKYTSADVTIAGGYAFRGWFTAAQGGKKIHVTDSIKNDLSLYAVTTLIEVADDTSTYTYDLTDSTFDPEDHECIEISDGAKYYNSHGWEFSAGQAIKVKIGGYAIISVGACQNSDGNNITITDADGKEVGKISDKDAIDGTIHSFNYKGKSSSLTLTFAGKAYVHQVIISNYIPDQKDRPLATLDNEPVTATFKLNLGTEGQVANFGKKGTYFTSSLITYGSNLKIGGRSQIGDGQTLFEALSLQKVVDGITGANESNAIRFIIKPNTGLSFTPKKVSLKTTRYDTDGGLLDVAWENPDKSKVSLALSVTPNSNNANPNVSELAYDIAGATVEEGACALLINLYNLPAGKTVGLSDIVIEGTLSGKEREVPQLATITINDVEYSAKAIFIDSYEASMELSKEKSMVSEKNPIKVTTEKGEVGTITYNGNNSKCTVTIPVSIGDNSVIYMLYLTQKPDYTITYYDTDKETVLGQYAREKGQQIGTFDVASTAVKVDEGYKFRGWYSNSNDGEKISTDYVVTGNLSLYAFASEIEVASDHKKYSFDLTNKNFDPENHEAFNPTGGVWHDTQHGWIFRNDDKIDLLVGRKATIYVTICRYGTGVKDIVITDANDKEIGKIPGISNITDGEIVTFNYEGNGGYITLNLSCTGEMYIHAIQIVNTYKTNYTKFGNWYCVKSGDISSLKDVLEEVNTSNTDSKAKRTYIFLPKGVYDFEKTVKTLISGYNISIIGQSTDSTIVKATPSKSLAGINKAGVLQSTGSGLYMQDLTLQNALDYYNSDTDVQAPVIQDAGNRSVYKNVRMLSYQNTYYSSNNSMQAYFEDCDLHGVMDIVSGGGDIRFVNTTLSLEPRKTDGSGERTIVAPRGTVNYGFVFDQCKVTDLAKGNGSWNFGRAWDNSPIAIYLNTTLDENAEKTLISTRWTPKGMNMKDPVLFGEYHTMDINGNNITPEINSISSYNGIYQTILAESQAILFSYRAMFSENSQRNWDPSALTPQVGAPTDAKYENGTVTWTAVDKAIAYALFKNDSIVAITEETSFQIEINPEADGLTIRAASDMGGLSEPAIVSGTTAIQRPKVETDTETDAIYTLQGVRVNKPGKGIYIINGKKRIFR